jgi:hypothetical protein
VSSSPGKKKFQWGTGGVGGSCMQRGVEDSSTCRAEGVKLVGRMLETPGG